ncbi:MAG TPA: sugar transferase [Candidatus Bathyarchaeia archaeon]|nr:sugar transferase [Candidatus Bathyarchaeia archaeon]
MSYICLKRLIDIVLAVFLSILFFPIWILIPLLILLESGRPIFYRHKRIGKDGKGFWLYKFRSMVVNADKVLLYNKRLLAEFKNGDWKLENDPRVTKLGRLLRNLTIDEFPQLLNVLKGEMSIVGPRAYLRQELDEQTKKHTSTKKFIETILSVKPGITGVWQTSGRNEIPFILRTKMDYDYAKSLSFRGDLKIILKTPKAMISKW